MGADKEAGGIHGDSGPSELDLKRQKERLQAFLDALPSDWIAEEDAFARRMRSEHASARSKLRKIYKLVDDMPAPTADHVACQGKGCSHCCKMNVTITSSEATLIGEAIGRAPRHIPRSVSHPTERFGSVPCTFLDEDGACSVYNVRPLACRQHFSFFESEHWCAPESMYRVVASAVRFTGPVEALLDVERSRRGVSADIRDFFPGDTK